MAYSVPQVRVFQEVAAAPAAVADTRAAHITGPHAFLVRYSIADEKALGAVGTYAEGAELVASWPSRPAGALVDQPYTKVYGDEALLRYYQNLIGAGGAVSSPSSYPNRVRDALTSFVDNGTAYPKSAAMGDRGAKAGDTVYVRGVSGGDEYELWTTIRSFLGDDTAATVGASAAVSTNQADTTFLVSTETLGPVNAVTVEADGSLYDGRVVGVVDETYTVEVTSGSVGGDFTTARLRVTSASGLDDDSDVIPADANSFTPIGANGLLVRFALNDTSSASLAAEAGDIAETELSPGQKWSVRVRQAFTTATHSSAGTYTGLKTATYILEVTRGGAWADLPEVSVSTNTGYDAAGPVVVASDTSFAVGSYGVTVKFPTGSGLRRGDKYTVVATAVAEGAKKTIVLADDLPAELVGAADLDLKLYIKDDVEIDRYRPDDLSLENWTPETTQLTLADEVQVAHPDWTVDGDVSPLPVESAAVFVEYRAWLTTYAGVIGSVTSSGGVVAALGPVVPDNPLAWGVYMAALNAGGATVYFSSVSDPDDLDDWLVSLSKTEGLSNIYNVVPLSSSRSVQDAFVGHADAQSDPAVGNWRGTVLAAEVGTVGVVVDETLSSDEGVILATLADDPTVTGTQYTRLSVPAANSKFQTNGVRAGDTVRYLYGVDASGQVTYSEFTVDTVVSESTLTLLTGHTVAVPVASKVEIWRTYTAADHTALIKAQVARFENKRVVAVANPTVTGGGYEFAGYFAAAAVAGLRSGTLPHRPLTNVTLTGIDGMGTVAAALSGSQLNEIAEEGGWWIYRDMAGSVYNRHGRTTDTGVLANREESVRSNFDSISRSFRATYLQYIGATTITESLLEKLRFEFENVARQLISIPYGNLGPQLVSFENLTVRQDAAQRDKVLISADLTVPAPLNYIDMFLTLFL